MEAVKIENKRKIGFVSSNNGVITQNKHHSNMEEFLKGTISGEELVKYVCNSLDKKYNDKNQPCCI